MFKLLFKKKPKKLSVIPFSREGDLDHPIYQFGMVHLAKNSSAELLKAKKMNCLALIAPLILTAKNSDRNDFMRFMAMISEMPEEEYLEWVDWYVFH